jgi:hypothetical protein
MSILNSGWDYMIKNRFSDKYLSVGALSQTPGTAVIQWQDVNGTHQKWKAFDLGNEIYQFQILHSSQMMSLYRGELNNGTWIIQYPMIKESTVQNFQLRGSDEKDYYYMISESSGKAVDIYGMAKNDGANVVIWDLNNGYNQKWYFEPRGP